MILVDGISGALFYAFDKVADKTLCFHKLSREFSSEQLKNSRSNFFQAFSTAGYRGKYPRKTKDIYHFSRSLGKDNEN